MKSEVLFQRENLVWNHDIFSTWCLAYAPVPLRSVQNSKIWNCDCPLLPNISYPLMYSSRITLPNDESVKKQLALNHKKFHLFASSIFIKHFGFDQYHQDMVVVRGRGTEFVGHFFNWYGPSEWLSRSRDPWLRPCPDDTDRNQSAL